LAAPGGGLPRQTSSISRPAGATRPASSTSNASWSAPKLPDSPSNRMDVWKGEVIAPAEEELLSGIQG
jgi:hypothetical protein